MTLGFTGLCDRRGLLALSNPLLGNDGVERDFTSIIVVTSGALWDQGSDSGDAAYTDGGRTLGSNVGIESAKISSFTPTSGKWYFEIEWVVPGATGNTNVRNIGVGFQDSIDTDFPGGVYDGSGQPSNSLGASSYQNNGTAAVVEAIRTEGSFTLLNTNQCVDGTVIGIALDIGARRVYYSFDDSFLIGADPEAGTGGEDISGDTDPGTVSVWANVRDLNQRIRLRTEAAQLTGTVPSGYNQGWGA